MFRRIFLVVLDSVGIGALPDAPRYGDAGAHTLGHVAAAAKELHLPQLQRLGLGLIDKLQGIPPCDHPLASYGKMAERSVNKDTTSGHWELAGTPVMEAFPVYPQGFPEEITAPFCQHIGRGILGNKAASGTVIIEELGEEHLRTGFPIVYTSADSVFQIAAHEDVVPVEQLYEYCKIARKILCNEHAVGRVIARPFIGENGNYTRTTRRHDFSLEPPGITMLDQVKQSGMEMLSVGKIKDIFAGRGVTDFVYTTGNQDGIEKSLAYMDRDFEGLCFINLVDYDMLYGHRNDIDGYAKALTYFDERLSEILQKLREDDVLMITADHGCDPSYTQSTDHSREYTPFVMYGKKIEPKNYGTRDTFADIGATVLKYLGVSQQISGNSML